MAEDDDGALRRRIRILERENFKLRTGLRAAATACQVCEQFAAFDAEEDINADEDEAVSRRR